MSNVLLLLVEDDGILGEAHAHARAWSV